jgi:hypothetical protein
MFHNQANCTHFVYSFQKSTKHAGSIFDARKVKMAHFFFQKANNINYFLLKICSNIFIKHVPIADLKLPLLLPLALLIHVSSLRWMLSGSQVHPFVSSIPQNLSLKFRCFFNEASSWTKPHSVSNTKMNIALLYCDLYKWSDWDRGCLVSQYFSEYKCF